MKRNLVCACLVSLISLCVEAKVFTVSNVTGASAMYTDVQPAVDAAALGDTVFVHASPNKYGGTYNVRKRIVLLGEGTGSYLYQINIDSLAGQPASGLVIDGIQLDYMIVASNGPAQSIKGVIFTNCYVNQYATLNGPGYIIVKNIFAYYVNLGSNSIFSNNIVAYYVANGSNNVIANNIFVKEYSNNYGNIRSVTNCSVTNNIFLILTPVISGGTNNTYSKNIQVGTDLPTGNFSGIQVSPSGALASVVFSETGITTGMDAGTLYRYYWSQLATSPAKNAGTDGKDLGIYGGSYPWATGKLFSGDPGLPKVTLVEVQNAVLAPGGTLKINIKAKSASTK